MEDPEIVAGSGASWPIPTVCGVPQVGHRGIGKLGLSSGTRMGGIPVGIGGISYNYLGNWLSMLVKTLSCARFVLIETFCYMGTKGRHEVLE